MGLAIDIPLRGCVTWPDGVEFGTPDEIAALRRLVPPFMRLGQVLAFAPAPPPWIRGCTPWRRLDAFLADFDRIVTTLVDKARADPRCAERTNILSVLLRGGRCEGSAALSDELLTLIGAGYETTAATLAWTFERLRRHPDVLADLHEDPENFTDPGAFDPRRFLGVKPVAPTWLAFGGGTRRCLGADFAITEMDVVLRTVLRHVRIHTDDAADEKSRFHGVAHAPKRGGRIVVDHRTELSWQTT